jgi:hypothetical protein
VQARTGPWGQCGGPTAQHSHAQGAGHASFKTVCVQISRGALVAACSTFRLLKVRNMLRLATLLPRGVAPHCVEVELYGHHNGIDVAPSHAWGACMKLSSCARILPELYCASQLWVRLIASGAYQALRAPSPFPAGTKLHMIRKAASVRTLP